MDVKDMTQKYYRLEDFQTLWKHRPIEALVPEKWVQAVRETYQLDEGRKKVFFLQWLRLMIYYLLMRPKQASMRDIARETKDDLVQLITGIEGLSYTTLGTYIKELEPKALDRIIRRVQSINRQLCKAQGTKKDYRGTFDATFLDASLKDWRWAAPNGTRKIVQLHLRVDLTSGIIGHWAFDTQTTSSNTCLEELIQSIPPNSLTAFDRGYTELEKLIGLARSERHWVSKFYNGFTWTPVEERPLPPDQDSRRGKRVITDVIGWLGHEHQGGPILTRKITVRVKKGKYDHYLTSDLKTDPVELIDFYSDHWAIENLFRSVKRYLEVEMVVSHDPVGVINWLLLHLLFLQLLSLQALMRGSASILKRFVETMTDWRRALHADLVNHLIRRLRSSHSCSVLSGGDYRAFPSRNRESNSVVPLAAPSMYT